MTFISIAPLKTGNTAAAPPLLLIQHLLALRDRMQSRGWREEIRAEDDTQDCSRICFGGAVSALDDWAAMTHDHTATLEM